MMRVLLRVGKMEAILALSLELHKRVDLTYRTNVRIMMVMLKAGNLPC